MSFEKLDSGKYKTFPNSEIERIEKIYSERNYDKDHDYSETNLVYLHRTQSVEKVIIDALNKIGLVHQLSELKILDYGCGNGRWMSHWLTWGATPQNLSATDVRESALKCAYDHVPQADIRLATDKGLDYPSSSFDIVYQNVVFSSILDHTIRKNAAREITRVMKPGGCLFWYDFVFNNPNNKNVRKIVLSELQSIFPGFQVAYHKKIVLAPPIARWLVPTSWALADMFEMLPFLRTHLFVVLRKQEQEQEQIDSFDTQIKIRHAVPDDIRKIASVHMEAFPGFPLTLLGKPFLKILYNNFAMHEDGICFVAEYGDEIIGFAAGALRPQYFFRKMLVKKGIFLLFASLIALIYHPIITVSALQRALFYRGERPDWVPDSSACLVSSMAVAPFYSGRGVGIMLLEEMCQEAQRCGVTTVYLTTDAQHNIAVNDFYCRRGFKLVNKLKRKDGERTMNLYIRKL